MIHRFFSAKHLESKYFCFAGCLQEQGLCNDDEACFDGKLDLGKKKLVTCTIFTAMHQLGTW